jgi:indolepyruvate ferredoxin oxidoreductase, beta subunit
MKNDIIISGVGGQGILSIAAIIGLAAIENNLFLKQAEVHGMSQRGGDVQSHLRLSSQQIYSDLIPYGKADIIISLEPMESLRYLPWLSENGWLVTNSNSFINIPDYPDTRDIMTEIEKVANHIIIDADTIAKNTGSLRSGNMVILGASSPFIDIPFKSLESAIKNFFSRKGMDIIDYSLKSLHAGRDFTGKQSSRNT